MNDPIRPDERCSGDVLDGSEMVPCPIHPTHRTVLGKPVCSDHDLRSVEPMIRNLESGSFEMVCDFPGCGVVHDPSPAIPIGASGTQRAAWRSGWSTLTRRRREIPWPEMSDRCPAHVREASDAGWWGV